ncbi:MAG: tryptophan-rich sensory protein [Clostridia bacterium]|nr:tryptophan-rich sensory protein [Clostridia bacterium]
MNKVKTYVIAILIPLIVGGVVGFITSPAMDYSSLEKPFLAPPSFLFPIVWTILYVLMGVSYGILKSNGLTDADIDKSYYLQLAVNALWSIFFFSLEWRLFAFVWIILLLVLVVNMTLKFYEKNRLAGWLQVPYILWVLFASYLNIAIYILNR